jgi:hypothetical protein
MKINRKYCFLSVLLVVLPILVYFPTFQNDFLFYWDDQWQVTNRFSSGDFTFENLYLIFSQSNGGQYSPINQLMYTALYTFFGYNPVAFHAASLIVHIINTLLVYSLLIGVFDKTEEMLKINIRIIAFMSALLFAIHPVNVESVAWVSASKIPVYTLFYLAGLNAYLKYIENERIKWFIFTIFCFIISFGCKEQTVTFPVSLLLIDWFLGRKLRSEKILVEKIPFFVLSLFFGLVTVTVNGLSSGVSDYPFGQRLLFSCYAIFEYITKTLLPIQLNYLYPFPMDAGNAIPLKFWIFPFLILGLSFLPVIYRKNRIVMFGVLWFFIHISLSLNIISLGRYAMIADRYLYIGITGLSIIITYIVNVLYSKYNKLIVSVLFTVYLCYLGTYTFIYTQKWQNSDTVKQYLRELSEDKK